MMQEIGQIDKKEEEPVLLAKGNVQAVSDGQGGMVLRQNRLVIGPGGISVQQAQMRIRPPTPSPPKPSLQDLIVLMALKKALEDASDD